MDERGVFRSRKRPRKWMGAFLFSTAAISSVVTSFEFRASSTWTTAFNKHRARTALFQVRTSSSGSLVAEASTADSTLESPGLALPPWLSDSFAESLDRTEKEQRLQDEWEFLQMELEDQGWSKENIEKVMEAILVACSSSPDRDEWTLGCLEFLQTLLEFREVATPAVVLASILHYVECVMARQNGVYDSVRAKLLSPVDGATTGSQASSRTGALLLPSSSKLVDIDMAAPDSKARQLAVASSPVDKRKQKRIERRKYRRNQKQQLLSNEQQFMDLDLARKGDVDDSSPFSGEVLELAQAASQIKRAEIVSDVVLARKRRQDHDQVQNLLVSVSGQDWRALAIRCVASLYRLQANRADPTKRMPETIATARSAMQVYAPLAQRMGLHVLKTRLENKAFYQLYPRQYKTAVTLFERQGDAMKAVQQYLQQQIWHLLQQDSNLKQVAWKVNARVKEPYSFWKKLQSKQRMLHPTSPSKNDNAREIIKSMLRVRDAVALRIIVESPPVEGESDDEHQTRDKLLCYYVHQLIRSVFPESDASSVKDYIANPKPNGYQSLHHTSSLKMDQLEIPFEIQVRSQDMHRIAEFGIAAHWDYKRAPKASISLSTSASTPSGQEWSSSAKSLQESNNGSRLIKSEKSSPSETSQYLQALEAARQSLVQSSAFVFVAGTSMEHGQLVSVEKGERILDIWNNVLSEIITDMPTAWRNGRLAGLNEIVQNGDVLMFQQEDDVRIAIPRRVLQEASKK